MSYQQEDHLWKLKQALEARNKQQYQYISILVKIMESYLIVI
jgi:hypothetical protein